MSLSPARVLICACLVVGCSGPESVPEPVPEPVQEPAQPEVPATAPAVEEVKAAPEGEAAPAVEAAPIAEAAIGVERCDGYVERYRACIAERMPPAEQERHRQVLAAQVATWQAAKADPKLAAALADECAAAAEAARAMTRIIGCVWREGDAPRPELPKAGTQKYEVRGPRRPLEYEELFPPRD